jgi:hypothetical protein
MTESDARRTIRNEAIEEDRLNDAEELKAERKIRLFSRTTLILGALLVLDVILVSQFLRGHQWYEYRESIGKCLLILAGCLLSAFMLYAGLAFGLWRFLRGIKEVHRRYAPPLSRHRTGSNGKA